MRLDLMDLMDAMIIGVGAALFIAWVLVILILIKTITGI